jgi:hypothetical protein
VSNGELEKKSKYRKLVFTADGDFAGNKIEISLTRVCMPDDNFEILQPY